MTIIITIIIIIIIIISLLLSLNNRIAKGTIIITVVYTGKLKFDMIHSHFKIVLN